MLERREKTPQKQETPAACRPQPREVESRTLLGGSEELLIRHGDQVYSLRRTGKGGLILTK